MGFFEKDCRGGVSAMFQGNIEATGFKVISSFIKTAELKLRVGMVSCVFNIREMGGKTFQFDVFVLFYISRKINQLI